MDGPTGPGTAIARAADLLRRAKRVAVSTGAGMSAEAGIATFRDRDGQWSKFNPEELATPQAFARQPQRVWEWYRARRAQLATVEPHTGHRVLARWERSFHALDLITQNVDGLHERAGSTRVIELHGRLDVACCVACAQRVCGLEDLGPDPHCGCGARLRPGVVWFGESLPPGAWEAAQDAAERCEVMMVIGTSGVVQPAASLAQIARIHGARVIEINPQPTPISSLADVRLAGTCAGLLSALDAALGDSASPH